MIWNVILLNFCCRFFRGSSVAVTQKAETPSRGPPPRSTAEKRAYCGGRWTVTSEQQGRQVVFLLTVGKRREICYTDSRSDRCGRVNSLFPCGNRSVATLLCLLTEWTTLFACNIPDVSVPMRTQWRYIPFRLHHNSICIPGSSMVLLIVDIWSRFRFFNAFDEKFQAFNITAWLLKEFFECFLDYKNPRKRGGERTVQILKLLLIEFYSQIAYIQNLRDVVYW